VEAPHHADVWEVEVYLHAFLTSALDGAEWLASHPGCFTLHESTPVPTGKEAGWAQAGMDVVAKRNVSSCWESNPSCPLCSLVHSTN
jgi:hypothetical protein